MKSQLEVWGDDADYALLSARRGDINMPASYHFNILPQRFIPWQHYSLFGRNPLVDVFGHLRNRRIENLQCGFKLSHEIF